MEGLIPYLIHALKKQKSHSSSSNYRSFFGGSSYNYHLLVEGDSAEGSPHRQSRSEFHPLSVQFLEQRSGIEFIRSRSINKGSFVNAPSRSGGLYNNDSRPQQVDKRINNNSY